MYTNGVNANEENLRALGEAGLDELRFNLGASGTSDRVIAAMATAKKYIPRVGVETPMTREFYKALIPEPHHEPGPDPAGYEDRGGRELAHRSARLQQ